MLSSVVIPSFNVSDVCSLFFIQYSNIFFGHCFKFDKFLNTSSRYQGRCSKDRSHHYCPGWNPGVDAIFGFTLLLRVLSLTQRGFSLGTPVSCSLKASISKFEFDQESGRQRTTVRMCYLFIVICLFVYLFFVKNLLPPFSHPCATCSHTPFGW